MAVELPSPLRHLPALSNLAGHSRALGVATVRRPAAGLAARLAGHRTAGPPPTRTRLQIRGLARLVTGRFAFGLTAGFAIAFTDAFNAGIGAAIVVVYMHVRATSAWIYWLVLVRGWLPLTGRLPWQVQAFLTDAYQRGVLRQTGTVYQFRHARLQDHLTAGTPTTAPATDG